jgi:hypothetical protein
MKVRQLAIALTIEGDSSFDLVDDSVPLDMISDLKQMFGPLI